MRSSVRSRLAPPCLTLLFLSLTACQFFTEKRAYRDSIVISPNRTYRDQSSKTPPKPFYASPSRRHKPIAQSARARHRRTGGCGCRLPVTSLFPIGNRLWTSSYVPLYAGGRMPDAGPPLVAHQSVRVGARGPDRCCDQTSPWRRRSTRSSPRNLSSR